MPCSSSSISRWRTEMTSSFLASSPLEFSAASLRAVFSARQALHWCSRYRLSSCLPLRSFSMDSISTSSLEFCSALSCNCIRSDSSFFLLARNSLRSSFSLKALSSMLTCTISPWKDLISIFWEFIVSSRNYWFLVPSIELQELLPSKAGGSRILLLLQRLTSPRRLWFEAVSVCCLRGEDSVRVWKGYSTPVVFENSTLVIWLVSSLKKSPSGCLGEVAMWDL